MKKILPQIIVIPMLIWALYPENPYAYYILLRWICSAVFLYIFVQAYSQQKNGWAWIYGITAAIYNPIITVHLNRTIWSIINIATIGIAIASIFVIKTNKLSPKNTKTEVWFSDGND